MADQDVEISKVIDGLLAAQAAAMQLDSETLVYLIGLALDEAKAEAARQKTASVAGGSLSPKDAG